MSTTVKVQIQQRIDSSSNWTTANPTLLAGEVGWESNTKKYKIGDGSTAWASLAYAPGSGGYTAGTGVSISASNVITASAVALSQVFTAANQTAHLALTTQEGDVVVRSDENKSYVRNSGTAGSMADFTLLATPTDAVLSVNGNTGAITADQLAAAIEAASDSNTFTDADHTKLNGIETGAEVNVQSDWNASSGDAQILNKPTIPTQLTEEQVQDFVGGMLTGNTETGITVTYQDADGTIDFVVASQTDNNFTTTLKNKLDGIAASANNYSISTDLLDEDNFSTNSATKPPSQQSVKAYVDTADALKANLSGATFTGDVKIDDDSAANDTPELVISAYRPAIRFLDISGGPALDGEICCDTDKLRFRISSEVDGNTALTERATLDGSGNFIATGSVSDSKGELRTIVQTIKSAQHTIVAADSGKHSINSTGGWIINTSTGFTAGQAITLINNSGSDQTVTNTGCTMYLAGDTSTKSSLTLKGRGVATFICTASNVYYGSGAGLE
tara:strand:+ start:3544 stop:5055 length:1512 start_codon:yes stop_codon:yes gene_type:complete